MQTQNSHPNGQVQTGINSGPSSSLDSEFRQNAKKIKEEVVHKPPPKDAGEQPEYDKDKYGVPSKIIARKTHKSEVYYNCYWHPSKSGKVYHHPDWAMKKDIERIDGVKEMITQFEKERRQRAKTVPYYFIVPYFQSIFISSLLYMSLITLTRQRNGQTKIQR